MVTDVNAIQTHDQDAPEKVTYLADFTSILQPDETITDVDGTDANGETLGAYDLASTLAVGSVAIWGGGVFDQQYTAAGKGVQFTVRGGGAAAGSYSIRVVGVTSDGDTRSMLCTLQLL